MKDRLDLAKYKETLTVPLRQATLCFLIKDNQILLAMKKRGFAQGKWNGAGGKKDNEKDNNIEEAAIREAREEIGVRLISLRQAAVLNFYHLGNQEGGQQVTVYLSDKWGGEPSESEEMAPRWFDIKEIPYDQMWDDDRLWLPRVLKGEMLEADFLFDSNQKLLEQDIREIK
jgi:8-oxo-dGTP pyrophosphatase MutT (NUDIX family)